MWKEFFSSLTAHRESGKPFVVGTVVKVTGSTYRRPGARVLITDDGSATGLISGGCFESDLIEKARRTIDESEPVTVTFDTTSPDDLIFGLGLGCTGVAQILLEPFIGSSGQAYLDFIHQCVKNREQAVVATVFRIEGDPGVKIGSHSMIRSEGRLFGNADETKLGAAVLDAAKTALKQRRSRIQTVQLSKGTAEVLLEVITLPIPLLIIGAGPDALPLVRFAHQLGWHVTVMDRRPAFARADRFPLADQVVLCEPEDLHRSFAIDSETAAIIMTHHFETDLNFLKQILPSPANYIGILGPKAKGDLMLQKLQDEGHVVSKEQLQRVYNPVGLDLGAETPEEIAFSILSEIEAVRNQRHPVSLRDRAGPIHIR